MAPSTNGHAPKPLPNGKNDSIDSGNYKLESVSNTFRCRHLHAISFRNLVLPSASESDNEAEQLAAVPTELSQILSDEEALSSGDEAIKDDSAPLSPENQHSDFNLSPGQNSPKDKTSASKTRQNGTTNPPTSITPRKRRPPAQRQISRSMSTAFAEARQRAYEDRILSRRVTTFFSLHRVSASAAVEDAPIYVSEVQSTSMNPDFRPFDTGEIQDQPFLRSRRLVVRVWAKAADDVAYALLVEESVALPELHFVARDLDYVGGDFRDNTILYHFPDGVYAYYLGPSFERRSGAAKSKAPESKTASFDTLMKLKTLVDVIEDARETQQKVAAQIDKILKGDGGQCSTTGKSSAQDNLQTVRDAVARVGRDISRLHHERGMKQKRIATRKAAYTEAKKQLSVSAASSPILRVETEMVKKKQTDLTRDLRSHSARVAEDLLTIFPIEPIPEDPLSFTIAGCHCPHAKAYEHIHPPANEQEVSAALGFVATVVDSLSRTLLLHVPYQALALGSSSTVRDDISGSKELELGKLIPPGSGTEGETNGARSFPLYAKGADPARFRYAVYLLNRDVEELLTKIGLRVVDVRDTLGNLGYLLNSIAGTTRKLPQREAGKVAALRLEEQ